MENDELTGLIRVFYFVQICKLTVFLVQVVNQHATRDQRLQYQRNSTFRIERRSNHHQRADAVDHNGCEKSSAAHLIGIDAEHQKDNAGQQRACADALTLLSIGEEFHAGERGNDEKA